jgi:hypothetical protein
MRVGYLFRLFKHEETVCLFKNIKNFIIDIGLKFFKFK